MRIGVGWALRGSAGLLAVADAGDFVADFRAEVFVSLADGFDGLFELGDATDFVDEAVGFAVDGDFYGLRGGFAGEDEDFGVGGATFEQVEDFETVDFGELDVDDDEVGLTFEALLDRFATVSGHADDLEFREVFFEESAE